MLLKFPFSRFEIHDRSMEPFLHDGNRVLTLNWVLPKTGDVVVFKKGAIYMVKRIVKLVGNKVWVRGDNRLSSKKVSCNKNDIVGKVVFKY